MDLETGHIERFWEGNGDYMLGAWLIFFEERRNQQGHQQPGFPCASQVVHMYTDVRFEASQDHSVDNGDGARLVKVSSRRECVNGVHGVSEEFADDAGMVYPDRLDEDDVHIDKRAHIETHTRGNHTAEGSQIAEPTRHPGIPQEEVDRHNLTHCQFRSWCKVCLGVQGDDGAHPRSLRRE